MTRQPDFTGARQPVLPRCRKRYHTSANSPTLWLLNFGDREHFRCGPEIAIQYIPVAVPAAHCMIAVLKRK